MGEHTQQRGRSLSSTVDRVADALATDGALSTQSHHRIVELLRRFGRFVEVGDGVVCLEAITTEHVRAFVSAPGIDGAEPGLATQHLRRSAIRLLFRGARGLGLAAGDPTLDLHLPPRTSSAARPLSDEEVALCRTAALHSLTSTRLAASWALAEATARTAELPHLRLADLHLDRARVWIHGSSRTAVRWGQLSDWGRVQLERRVHDLGHSADPATLLVYGGDGSAESRQASSCQAIGETLRRAGLAGESDVRPVSAAAWAGARVLAETGRIEVVARTLGCRSLDAAARVIGFDWPAIEGDA